jgi:fatty acid desaturase
LHLNQPWLGAFEVPGYSSGARSVIFRTEDHRALYFIAITLALHISALFIAPNITAMIAWMIFATLMNFSSAVINHNHLHRPIFRSNKLNKILGIALSLARGYSSAGIRISHNWNHHANSGTDKDWFRVELAGQGWGLKRLLVFAGRVMSEVRTHRHEYFRQGRRLEKQIATEKLAIWFFVAAGMAAAPQNFLLLVIVPWLSAAVLLVAVNLVQHDDCPKNGSWNFTGPILNWFLFNNGFHSAHHDNPGAHWSELPAIHAEIKQRPSVYEGQSLTAHLFQRYILR